MSSRIRVASLEAWGSVAICLVHSDTVFVSLVVSGSAALISTSAASHTYTQHVNNQAYTSVQMAIVRVTMMLNFSFLKEVTTITSFKCTEVLMNCITALPAFKIY